jgi:glucose/arabinose dehydrogenase/cytochrome c5
MISRIATPAARAFLLLLFVGALPAAPAPFGWLQLEKSTVEITQVADGFDAPFDLAWGPDNHLWCTQLDGTVWRIDPATGERVQVARLAGVFYRKSHGLQSLAFHPHFATEPYVYLHYVYQLPPVGADEVVRSRLVRCRWDGAKLGAPETLVENLPGRSYHNGSRMIVGPDAKLNLSLGDAGDTKLAQDAAALNGKILRFNLDGTIPDDNPFPGSPVWTIGHRNPQGLAFGPTGKLYASEHGPNNDDEVNLIQPGHNYGWPTIEGFIDKPPEKAAAVGHDYTEPLRAWTPTVAPSGLAFYHRSAIPEWHNALLLANLKGRALRVLELNRAGDQITRERIFLQMKIGRIRAVTVSPAGDVYLVTSNTDWHPRFQPWMYVGLPKGPDHILRLHRSATPPPAGAEIWTEDLTPAPLLTEDFAMPPTTAELQAGQDLYAANCAACHRPDGKGAGPIKPLDGSGIVLDADKAKQIAIMLNGANNGAMPAWKQLSDTELAAVITYTKNNWSNKTGQVVQPSDLVAARK